MRGLDSFPFQSGGGAQEAPSLSLNHHSSNRKAPPLVYLKPEAPSGLRVVGLSPAPLPSPGFCSCPDQHLQDLGFHCAQNYHAPSTSILPIPLPGAHTRGSFHPLPLSTEALVTEGCLCLGSMGLW